MKFGKVERPGIIDFSLPDDHADTKKVLSLGKEAGELEIYVGCAKWNRKDLKGFYPRGTKDELSYYATQFNSIELNGTFYTFPSTPQVQTWKNKTNPGFKFFPKMYQSVSHYRRLIDTQRLVDDFCHAVTAFEEQLGTVFLQMHNNFKPKDFDRVIRFVEGFPKGIPLAVEVRNETWFSDKVIAQEFHHLLQEHHATNVVVDTAGRRDLMHMRLTSPHAMVRWVGSNHRKDYQRLTEWVDRIVEWRNQGLMSIGFFVHQNMEEASPLLSAYFIKKLNAALSVKLKVPKAAKVLG